MCAVSYAIITLYQNRLCPAHAQVASDQAPDVEPDEGVALLHTGETSEEDDDDDDADAYQCRHGARSSGDGARPSLAGSEEEHVVGRQGPGARRETIGSSRPQKSLLKLRKIRISRSKQLRRAIRLWFVCVF